MTPGVRPAAGAAARRDVVHGILLAVGASTLFAVLDSIAKYLAQTYPAAMVAWARYAFHVLAMAVVLLPRRGARLLATRRPIEQVLRGACLGISSITFFAALAAMPQAEATAVVAVQPILVSAVAILWLRERAPPGTWWALAASFAGVVLVIRPGTGLFSAVALLPLATAVAGTAYTLITRRIAGVDDSATTIFIGGIVATLMLSLLVPFHWRTPESWLHLLLFLCAGVVGAVGHLLLVRAYERASATTLAPYAYAHTVAALLMGWLVFGAFPDGWALAGIAVIVGSGVVIVSMRR